MKFSLNVSLLSLTIILLFASCTKEHVTSSDTLSTTIASDAITPDLSICKIRRIYQGPEDNPFQYTGLFTYNKAGNPYSVMFSGDLADFQFFYDSRNRLIEHRESAYGITWRHYYRHNALGQILIDSAINPGSDLKDTTIMVSTMQYDSQGRVVAENIVNTRSDGAPPARTRRPTYTYDNRGNLAVKDWKSSSYDNKINPLRQSPVLQFIMRNYSMNNAAVQAKYNSIGLPLLLKPSNDIFFGFYGASKIIYDCQ